MDVRTVEVIGDREQGAQPVQPDAGLDLAVEGACQGRKVGDVQVGGLRLDCKQELLLPF